METLANLIKAIAALLWPTLGFVFLFLYRKEIRELLKRLKKGKILGQELELEESLKELNASAIAAESAVSQLPPAIIETEKRTADSPNIEDILKMTATSPKAALVILSSVIETEARDLVAVTGNLKGRKNLGLHEAIETIITTSVLPPHVADSLKHFSSARNRIVHGFAATDDDVLRAIDSGITILKTLQAIPRETNIVYDPDVTIYSDPELKTQILGAKGIMLKTTSPGGAQTFKRIFPSTQNWFRKGQRVSWEWSFANKWGNAWYRDSETNETKAAWSSAAEFVGRPLETL